eukprot:gb/GECG01010422.1/.p1 GENE.gb/GECG01010422.1/~~gb/GECG01010422.1/.p1  ORF type:complete len:251 (+),score=28.15 gb/GECG01010422.1/:1-753(+)
MIALRAGRGLRRRYGVHRLHRFGCRVLSTTGSTEKGGSNPEWKIVQYSSSKPDVITAVLGNEVRMKHHKQHSHGSEEIGNAESSASRSRSMLDMLQRLREKTLQYFLPEGYPTSVDASYAPYVAWHALAMCLSTTMGVLSMQAMFHSVGMGAGSLPVAAVVNWVLKDGIGQLGGVIFASSINTNFDTDPKRWRFVSALVMDGSCLLEACTCLNPALFLPIASIANIGKNVGWLSASATKAGIHQVRVHSW